MGIITETVYRHETVKKKVENNAEEVEEKDHDYPHALVIDAICMSLCLVAIVVVFFLHGAGILWTLDSLLSRYVAC